jgi:hypothetical protein
MTFRKAIRLKAKQSSIFEESGIIHKDGIAYKVFVTPENNDDFMRYLRDIRGFYSQLTDSVAKKYSKNGKFAVYGLCYNSPNILYTRL